MSLLVMWIVVSAAALLVDILTSSFFFAGFTVGGIAAMITWMLKSNFLTQLIIFIFVSAAAITVEYVWFRKKVKESIPITPRMEEEYIGRTITADEDIEVRGRMKVEGIYWAVENTGEKINKGEKAKIIGIKGNKLLIKK